MAQEPLETVEIEEPVVVCDGGDPDQGHPRVFLNTGDKGSVDCPYCDRRFVLRRSGSAAAQP